MLDDKKLKEIETRAKQYLQDEIVFKIRKPEYVDFFLENAKNAIDTAELLLKASTDKDFQEKIEQTINGLLWVINASYYSMFYTARALLEKYGYRLKTDLSIHMLTFDTLVYFFYLTKKLEKQFIEEFAQAEEEAAELLGQEKAKQVVQDYAYEKGKRSEFTYEMGAVVLESKAKTSLERAKKFNEELGKLIQK